ncbi:MAG: hypothetical protein QCI38_00010 [Candidatus Thermoplasmatota archaeon]|nr:hypothetical protein [Candidatus Thermoplasmatota archaeon]
MIERPKLVAMLTAMSILGLVMLYAYSSSIEPIPLSPHQVGGEHVGKLVQVEGPASDVFYTKTGFLILEIADLSHPGSVVVFIDSSLASSLPPMFQGYILRITGKVELYQGKYEIIPSTPDQVEILDRSGLVQPSMAAILANPQVFQGMNISVRGRVETVWRNENFWVMLSFTDGSRLMVKTNAFAYEGEEYVARGVFDYDSSRGWWHVDET